LTFATFTGSYDPTFHTFHAETTGVQNLPSLIADIYWPISTVGERYGGQVAWEWKTTMDSLNVTKPFVIPVGKILGDNPWWFVTTTENAALVPMSIPVIPFPMLGMCCVLVSVSDVGPPVGGYPPGGLPMGPVVKCDPATGNIEVGYGWETSIYYKYVWGYPPFIYWGQDAKSTRTYTPVICVTVPFHTIQVPVGATTSRDPNGNPGNGATYGNDDYRIDNNGGYLDTGNLIKSGTVRYWDEPSTSGTLPNGVGLRCTANDHFMCRADPECPPVPPVWCCKVWDVSWDVTFCQNCSATIQNSPPTMSAPVAPAVCPGLAP
jgi:hypothetical protein